MARWFPILVLACGAVGLVACGGGCCDGPAAAGPLVQQAPDFELEDVNDTSATYAQALSPSDYAGRISAWYFGHAT